MYQRQKFKRVQISKDVTLKSGLEEVVYTYLTKHKCTFKYEGLKVTYFQPEIKKTYKPDFPIRGSFIIETKGAFNSADRKKMKLVKSQNPKLDIRFIFSNSKTKIGKKSKTTYAKWCELNDFPYHCIYSTKEVFPTEWLKEIQQVQAGN
jgi:predicted small secreted protein